MKISAILLGLACQAMSASAAAAPPEKNFLLNIISPQVIDGIAAAHKTDVSPADASAEASSFINMMFDDPLFYTLVDELLEDNGNGWTPTNVPPFMSHVGQAFVDFEKSPAYSKLSDYVNKHVTDFDLAAASSNVRASLGFFWDGPYDGINSASTDAAAAAAISSGLASANKFMCDIHLTSGAVCGGPIGPATPAASTTSAAPTTSAPPATPVKPAKTSEPASPLAPVKVVTLDVPPVQVGDNPIVNIMMSNAAHAFIDARMANVLSADAAAQVANFSSFFFDNSIIYSLANEAVVYNGFGWTPANIPAFISDLNRGIARYLKEPDFSKATSLVKRSRTNFDVAGAISRAEVAMEPFWGAITDNMKALTTEPGAVQALSSGTVLMSHLECSLFLLTGLKCAELPTIAPEADMLTSTTSTTTKLSSTSTSTSTSSVPTPASSGGSTTSAKDNYFLLNVASRISNGVIAGHNSNIDDLQAHSDVSSFVDYLLNNDILYPMWVEAVTKTINGWTVQDFPAFVSEAIAAVAEFKKDPVFSSCTSLLDKVLTNYDVHAAISHASLSLGFYYKLFTNGVKKISDDPGVSAAIVTGLAGITSLACELKLTQGSICPVASAVTSPGTTSDPAATGAASDGVSTSASSVPSDVPSIVTTNSIGETTTVPDPATIIASPSSFPIIVTTDEEGHTTTIPGSLVVTTDNEGHTVTSTAPFLITTTDKEGHTVTVPAPLVVTTDSEGHTVTVPAPLITTTDSEGHTVTVPAPLITTTDSEGHTVTVPAPLITTTDSEGHTVTVPAPLIVTTDSEGHTVTVPDPLIVTTDKEGHTVTVPAPITVSTDDEGHSVTIIASPVDPKKSVTSTITQTVTHCEDNKCITPTLTITTCVPENAPSTVIKTVCDACQGKTITLTVPCDTTADSKSDSPNSPKETSKGDSSKGDSSKGDSSKGDSSKGDSSKGDSSKGGSSPGGSSKGGSSSGDSSKGGSSNGDTPKGSPRGGSPQQVDASHGDAPKAISPKGAPPQQGDSSNTKGGAAQVPQAVGPKPIQANSGTQLAVAAAAGFAGLVAMVF